MAQTERGVLLRAGVIYTLANVLMKGISFFTIPLFIRLLTPEDFGRFNVFISFQSIIFMFSGLTLHSSIKNARYDKKENYDVYIKNCIYLDFFNSILIALIANTVCFFWGNVIELNFVEVNLLTILGFCGAVIAVYTSKLVMDYKAGDSAVVSLISVIVGIALSLLYIFTIFNFNHYLGRIIGLTCGEMSAAVYVLWRIFRDGFSPISVKDWKYGTNISLPIIPHGLSQIALSSANRIMIKYIYGAAKAGIFSFTYTVSMVPQVLFSSIANVWEPWFFERMDRKDMDQIRKKSNMFCLLISVVFVIMSCITPEIVKILATKEYIEAIDISIVVLMGCYFATLYNIPCEIEYFYKKTKHIATSTFICALVNIGLNLLLMHYFSYKVAAYVTLLAYFLYFLFHMYMSRYICKKWVFDIKRMSFIIIVSVIVMTITVLLMDNVIARYTILVAILLLFQRKKKMLVAIIKDIIKNGKNQ